MCGPCRVSCSATLLVHGFSRRHWVKPVVRSMLPLAELLAKRQLLCATERGAEGSKAIFAQDQVLLQHSAIAAAGIIFGLICCHCRAARAAGQFEFELLPAAAEAHALPPACLARLHFSLVSHTALTLTSITAAAPPPADVPPLPAPGSDAHAFL